VPLLGLKPIVLLAVQLLGLKPMCCSVSIVGPG
jgi:hypothetical protein